MRGSRCASTRPRWAPTGRRSARTAPRRASTKPDLVTVCYKGAQLARSPTSLPSNSLLQGQAGEGRVVEGDPVAPELPVLGEEALAQAAGELFERAPPRFGDLAGVAGHDLRVVRLRKEDVRAPRQRPAVVAKCRVRGDEIAAQLDVQARLLQRLAHGAGGDALAGLHAAAGRAPDVGGELRLADQRNPTRTHDVTLFILDPARR